MLALSLTQPHASLIPLGHKKIETRGWYTPYRGPLAIHASKGFPAWARNLCLTSPFRPLLVAARLLVMPGWGNPKPTFYLPLGAVIATAHLVDCVPIDDDLRSLRKHGYWDGFRAEHEYEFGDYRAGRWAWVLTDVQPLAAPVPARGSLGLWTWEEAA